MESNCPKCGSLNTMFSKKRQISICGDCDHDWDVTATAAVAPQEETARQNRIFLSYSRNDDEPFVHRLYQDLESAGFTVWFDRESLMSRGRTFHQEIKDAIRTEVDRVVYVGGPKAALSPYVGRSGSSPWNATMWS